MPALVILGRIDLLGFGQDLFGDSMSRSGKILQRGFAELGAQGCMVAISGERGISGDLGAVDRDYPRIDQTGLNAQTQDLPEQCCDRVLVAAAKPGQRGVIRLLVGRDHPHRHILDQPSLDPTRGPLPGAVLVCV
ncbi:hypothetical protein LAUMK13_05569 [Mycobacterium innocens]|uniref:Uncharacterized protein n=1 Tax=Mycobacterium innocens TaxID=2341083 RepID=A0A498QL65_9MYCO|nr:hypothetical protein LAUMK13_05569 [Mycobacterium innocens]